MTESEIKRLLLVLDSHKKKVLKSKKASQEFLVKTGIFTKKGNLTKNYRDLCMPQEQA